MSWEIVHDNGHGDYTERMEVPGGWIYRSVLIPYSETVASGVAMVFVPARPIMWSGINSEGGKTWTTTSS